jgi:glutathione S-transferase
MTTPVLEFAPNRYLAESGAILLFLAEGSEFLPVPGAERAEVHRWLFFEQSTIFATIAPLRFRLLTSRIAPDSDEARRMSRAPQAVVGVVEGQLDGQPFITGDRYTVADIALYGYLHVADQAGLSLDDFPRVTGWLERIRAQPRHVADLEAYPANARPGAGRSIYDALGI